MQPEAANGAIDAREQLLSASHVRPLMELVAKWRSQGLDVPNIDPNDGGIHAKVLFLLESPGPRAVGTNFISRDNPDPSARNFGRALDHAGFVRSDTLLWNVVPYCVSSIDRNRNASPSQIREAIPFTQAFIEQLRELKVVVLCGRRAQLAEASLTSKATVLKTFHPGAMSYNRLALRQHIHATFAEARAAISANV